MKISFKVWIDPYSYLFWSVLLLTVPGDWLLAGILAALTHEFCHLIMIYLLGGTVYRIDCKPAGMKIQIKALEFWKELLCALAGPAGSLLLILVCNLFPKVSICGFLQGLYNLIPIYPLDGGRALRCCLYLLIPGIQDNTVETINRVIRSLLFILLLSIELNLHLELLAMLTAVIWIAPCIYRKKPCKRGRFHVQ